MPSRSFPAFAMSVPDARRYVTEILGQLPEETCQTAALLVSELATNAIRHARGHQFEVSVEHDAEEGRLWVGVTDSGRALPVPRSPAVTDEHGRGLQLVGSLSDHWGVRRRRDAEAKTVWFELAVSPAGRRTTHREPEPSA